MERALTQSSLSVSLLPSMDYLWAGDDRSAGLQSGWLGSGKLLPRFLTHTQELQKPSFTLSQPFLLCSTPSAKSENLIFIWPNGITLSVLWKNNLLRVGIRGCSKWVGKHASSVSWTWPSFMEFNCFFPLALFAILKLNVMFLSSRFEILIALKIVNGIKTRQNMLVNEMVHLQSVWMWRVPWQKEWLIEYREGRPQSLHLVVCWLSFQPCCQT